MEKLTKEDGESLNIVNENIKALEIIFPDAFTEDGIDFDVLLQLLGNEVAEGEEKYGLTWYGKKISRQLALTPSTGTLRPCPEESIDWDTTQNLFIEGDNLEVLKLLQKSYAGKVQMIYIDPPYNTGKEFIYSDNFQDNLETYLQYTGQKDDKAFKTSSNTETSGRYHTNWLNMMYPRLKLARLMLCMDGLLFVSISDSEVHHLRGILDEIFGQENFIGNIIWNSTKSITNTALLSVSHTHILIYAREKDYFTKNRSLFRFPEKGEGFENPDNDPRGPWKADPFQVGNKRLGQLYTITNPKTGIEYRPNPGSSWKNEKSVFQQLLKENRIVFGHSGEAGPQRKRFLSEATKRGKVSNTLWNEDLLENEDLLGNEKPLWNDLDTTTNATRALKALMGSKVFDGPKPVDLIARCCQLGTHDPDALVLDFFAGSGTTGHAVLLQNAADSGRRRHILIQLPEPLDPTNKEHGIAVEYCDQLGTPRTIAELAKERLRKAAKSIKEERPDLNGDLGFKVFKLDSSNIRTWKPDASDLGQTLLDHAEHLVEGRSEQDILYELLLKRGVDLAAPIEQRQIVDKTVYSIGDGALVTCLDESIDKGDIEVLGEGITDWLKELKPATDAQIVFRDSAFADDISKTNMTAILEQNGITHVRSL